MTPAWRRTGAALVALLAAPHAAAQAPAEGDPAAALAEYLATQVDSGAFPGAVVLVGHKGVIVWRGAFGRYGESDRRAVTDSTVYDLASLTKVVGLTTAVMLLVADGHLALDRTVSSYLPAFAGGEKNRVTVRDLLLHRSGLPAWRPLYREASTRAAALDSVLATPLDTAPGARYVYSDLGAILLTQVAERVAEEPLDVFLTRRVYEPLGMNRTRYLPPAAWRWFIAPTERDPWRGRVLRGEVHDENTARLGGISGHAGLFATADDLARFAFWLLDALHDRNADGPVPLPPDLVRDFTRRGDDPSGSTRALGWDTPSASGSSGGHCLSAGSFGHTGFTGTSLWVDPEADFFVILLTNRVHPTRQNLAIRRVRPVVSDLAARIAGRPCDTDR